MLQTIYLPPSGAKISLSLQLKLCTVRILVRTQVVLVPSRSHPCQASTISTSILFFFSSLENPGPFSKPSLALARWQRRKRKRKKEQNMQIEEVLQILSDPIQRTLQVLRLEPAAYMFLFPKNLAEKIEIAVKNNEFPLFERLAPAIVYTVILGILRMILTFAVELLAIRVMQLGDYHKQEYDAEMDAIYLAVVNECELKKKENVKRLKQINNKEEKDLAREDFNLELKKLEKNQINNYSKTRKLKSDLVLQYYQIKSNNVKRRKKVVKFVEALWRLIFYGVFCYVGYNALFVPQTAEWIVDTKKHWDGWPNHKIGDVSWLEFYYLVELGSYFHQLLWTEVLLFMLSSITILRTHLLIHSGYS